MAAEEVVVGDGMVCCNKNESGDRHRQSRSESSAPFQGEQLKHVNFFHHRIAEKRHMMC